MSFDYTINGKYTDQPTVYRMTFGTTGKKFYIFKGKNLGQSVHTICKDIARYRKNGAAPTGHLLEKVVNTVIKGRISFCKVDVLLQTDDVTALLGKEKLTLEQSKADPNCLNIIFEPHVPKWISEIQESENKPLQSTIVPIVVPTPDQEPVNAAMSQEVAQKPKSSKLLALQKLKDKI